MLVVRYRETGRTADVVIRHDEKEGLVLVGRGNPFYLESGNPFYPGAELLESNAEWTVGAETFHEDWDLVEASDQERARLRDAGFRV